MRRSVFRSLEQMRQLTFSDPERVTCESDRGRAGNAVLDRIDIDPAAIDADTINTSATFSHDECRSSGRSQSIRKFQRPCRLELSDLAWHAILHIDAEEIATGEGIDV